MLHTDDKTLEFNVEKLFVCSGSFSSTKIANNRLAVKNFQLKILNYQCGQFKPKKLKSKSKNTTIHTFQDKAIAKLLIKFHKKKYLYEVSKCMT